MAGLWTLDIDWEDDDVPYDEIDDGGAKPLAAEAEDEEEEELEEWEEDDDLQVIDEK
jgi:hypothetical protein